MVNIICCVKQVPNTDNVKFDWSKGSLIRTNIENILNPDDIHAIELALQIKEASGGKITVITMGPPQAEEILREAYSYGVDRCVLITDSAFAGSDTLVTSKILHRAIKKLESKSEKFDIILTGFETLDGNTSQVSYQLSEFFHIPHITKVHKIDIQSKNAIIERLYGHEFQKIKVELPILIAATRENNKVRYPTLLGIKTCFEKKIELLTLKDIGGTAEEYGLQASPTITLKGDITEHKRKREAFEGTIDEKIDKLVAKLKKYELVKY
jgi:electron transfer flavoprotein beta subunit